MSTQIETHADGYRMVVHPAAKACEYDGWVYYLTADGSLRMEETDGDGIDTLCLPVVTAG